ncbi:MAG TPA: bifunctional (p)ppGpp synthetase/guanosine-3',5'-bis(diphosphate) 3'-pyrophosphohydrolase, partial [Bacteroidales bacterium]|nr:bifunctional (p)ppGpp synthetase/guanosine-3',5'-bis(diphosphate) 3'-pyrophosphohydrolase [Bacteroidales bacterium]
MITFEEEKAIREEFESILKQCNSCQKPESEKLIRRAFEFAYEAHKDIRRKSGEPYIYHPLAVAKIVINNIGLGTTSFVASLLHDVVEDTDYTIEDIRKLFGDKVAYLIDGLTKISSVVEGKNVQVENFKKILLTLSKDVRVILVKIADRLHNLRTMDAMPDFKKIRTVSESISIYIPLAHRLGLYPIKTEMEDIAFKFQNPLVYDEILNKLRYFETNLYEFIELFTDPIIEDLDALGIKFSINARTKSVASIFRKMKKKGVPFEEIYDIFAIRVVFEPNEIFSEKSQCWAIYSVITDVYRPKPDRLRDWISNPKPNGYEALHTTVMGPGNKWVEVQIRSKRMNDIAEYGYAAHWKYKENKEKESEIDIWIERIREILEDNLTSEEDFLRTFEMDIFSNEILVFTPKGEVRPLKRGATALDFAYDIHSEIGNHAIGAKINYKLEGLDYVLESGDQVEIITSDTQKPQREWLNFITTTKARSKIKAAFKEERKKNIEKGKNILIQVAKENNVMLNSVVLTKLMNYFEVHDKEELYCKVGGEFIDLSNFKKIVQRKRRNKYVRYWALQLSKATSKITPKRKTPINKTNEKDEKRITLTERLDWNKYVLAKCCNPIPGDDVIAYKLNKGIIEVHKKECKYAIALGTTQGKTALDVHWKSHKILSFLVRIEINGIDRMGLLNSITHVISNRMYVNMRAVKIDATSGYFGGYIDLYVHNKDDL